ncbi:hypothetical protein [Staphylococcus pseudintermedius]|uniref:hypothetical protein n=1 Tax=Staphylococcus pseudintermedius TaxID=283734 RepID=UPI0018C6DB1C|nr:hypothetical protein [Staphylococcus aureus]
MIHLGTQVPIFLIWRLLIKINGKKVAGLSAIDEENDSTEPTDPAIKSNQKFKHKKGS